MKNKLIISLLLTALPSLAFADDHARIRIFGQNGAGAKFYAGQACHGGKSETVSGGMGSAFGSMLGLSSNKSLGIADTPNTKNLKKRNGILSKAYFKEYEIPANQPTTVTMGFQDVGNFLNAGNITIKTTSASCRGNISFIAKPNTDYEAGFAWDDKVCHLSISQVVKKDGGDVAELVPVDIKDAPKCN